MESARRRGVMSTWANRRERRPRRQQSPEEIEPSLSPGKTEHLQVHRLNNRRNRRNTLPWGEYQHRTLQEENMDTLQQNIHDDRSASISHTRLRLNFTALKYHRFPRKIVVQHQSVLFAMHLLKILNTTFCTAQVLLLCVKSCLPSLQNYSEIDDIVLPIRQNID